MAPAPFVNPPVVHRTAQLAADPYAPGFTYREAFDASATFRGVPGAAWAAAHAFAGLMRSVARCSEGEGTARDRWLLRRFAAAGPGPGQGPPPAQLDAVGYRISVTGTSDSGRRASASLAADGNAGYRSTPRLLVAAAQVLARGGGPGGFGTPGTVLGERFLADLQRQGVIHDYTVSAPQPGGPAQDARHPGGGPPVGRATLRPCSRSRPSSGPAR